MQQRGSKSVCKLWCMFAAVSLSHRFAVCLLFQIRLTDLMGLFGLTAGVSVGFPFSSRAFSQRTFWLVSVGPTQVCVTKYCLRFWISCTYLKAIVKWTQQTVLLFVFTHLFIISTLLMITHQKCHCVNIQRILIRWCVLYQTKNYAHFFGHINTHFQLVN